MELLAALIVGALVAGLTRAAAPPGGVAGGLAALDCTAQEPIVAAAACPG